jgi:uncharacterized membrane protein (DUF485 family)
MADLEQTPAPPVGEQIHMPEPSLLPIVNAFGVAIAIIGVTISRAMVVTGAIVFLVSTIIWIVKARREFDDLPAEHGH